MASALPAAQAAGGDSAGPSGRGQGSMPIPRLQGRYSYKMVKAQPVLQNELRCRRLPIWGRKDQLASRVYTALVEEGMGLSAEESEVMDAQLGLSLLVSSPGTGVDEQAAAVAAGEAPSEKALAADPLLALQSSAAGLFLTHDNSERTLSNASGLQLSFLWGSTAPNGVKHTTSCVMRTSKSVWLFECGEDSQRHLVRNEAIAWAKLQRIFISSLAADNILGLPGMLCTISAARERGYESADEPLHIYGPPGLTDFINTMLSVSRTYLEMPVVVHEFATQAVPPEQLGELERINPRARLYRTRLPPDQLNPQGFFDGEVRALLQRHTRKRTSSTGIDLRAGSLPLSVPPPGDPSRTGLHVSEMSWSIKADHEWLVRVAPLRNKQPTFGFLVQEAGRLGKLHVEVARALGVEEGANYTLLKNGESVPTPDGRIVHSAQCVGPPKRGRRVAILGACADSSSFARAAASRPDDIILGFDSLGPGGQALATQAAAAAAESPVLDLVVHAMGPPPGAPVGSAHSVARMAGATAAAMRAQELVLWQHQAAFSDSPEGQDPAFPAEALAAAKEGLGSNLVSLAGSYWCYDPERQPEADVREQLLQAALAAMQGSDGEG
ncbi:Zinc phosphodiesterase ELAC 1 isoform B [Chlorella sorokiniana]|uniref:Zinc phosphodiesterase ELAC 1 isoform B n=1 Tax=Chlorella sorokiniana TaxID=3076 RepID=A0A2P6TXL4_CHLSO|nr:Zinc phosphodiesterase ELAC 1 isoform B [Chlorella sorokiniana]|eukprot:PRW58804.1 Zinc phosphodiesterase ELAC 1 isoform B [Chlorella sorokiniana]